MGQQAILPGVLLLALLLIAILAGKKWYRGSTKENTLFFGSLILLISIIYSVAFLDYRILGPWSVEKARSEIVATKQDIARIAGLVIKSALVLTDGSGRFGGFPPEHKVKLKEYAGELEKLTDRNRGELMREVQKTIQELNDSIKKRTQTPNR